MPFPEGVSKLHWHVSIMESTETSTNTIIQKSDMKWPTIDPHYVTDNLIKD